MPVLPAPPTIAAVAAIEAAYAPPSWGWRTAGPVGSYQRTYWTDPADADIVAGRYLLASARSGPPGVRRVASPSAAGLVMDGGCAVVNIRFRLSTQALDTSCGGR